MYQEIYYYTVDVVYQKKGRYKKPMVFRGYNLHTISRAKDMASLNRCTSAIEQLKSQVVTGGTIMTFRVFNVKERKTIGVSSYYKEEDYNNEFG